MLEQDTLLLDQESEERLSITWDPQSFLPTIEPSSYTVDISLFYFERRTGQLRYTLHIMNNHANSGSATFSAPESNAGSLSEVISPVAVRVSVGRPTQSNADSAFIVNHLGSSGTRGEDSLGVVSQWTSTLYYFDRVPSNLCTQWSDNQQPTSIAEIRSRLPPCPPRVDQARAPNSGLKEDSGYWIQKSNRFFHPGAATCFRQSSFTRLVFLDTAISILILKLVSSYYYS